MADKPRDFVVESGGERLDRYLSERVDLSRSVIQRMIHAKDVLVNGSPGTPSTKLRTGDRLWMGVAQAPPTDVVPQNIPLDLCFMDEALMVVNKPAGLVVHPGKGNPDGTLVNGLVNLIQADVGDPLRPGLVHRIDKGTSGLLVVARQPRALTYLQEQFAAHSVHRIYLAMVWGEPDLKGRIEQPIGRHPVDRIRFACVEQGGKSAVTHWWRLASACHPKSGRGGMVSLVACRLETGRTHQIRVHMSSIGHSLVGDPLYGRKKNIPAAWQKALSHLDRQLLHAWQLGFVHPNGVFHKFDIDPPVDFIEICNIVEIDWQCAFNFSFEVE